MAKATGSTGGTENIKSKQLFIFLLTYVAYIGVYFTRKPFSVAKATLKDHQVHTESELGGIDTAFLFSYALAQFTAGTIEGAIGAKLGLTLCFVGTACCCFTFGSSESKELRSLGWTINGLFQALFFPFIMSVLSAWFPPSSRGRTFGLWTTCQQLGGFLTSAFGSYVLGSNNLTWNVLFTWSAYGAIVLAIVCFLILQEKPDKVKKPRLLNKHANRFDDKKKKNSKEELSNEKTKLSFCDVLFLKNMLNVGVAYFCIKLVRYIFLGWLPFYLVEVLEYKAADAVLLASIFDIAGAVGSISCGFISDKIFGGRSIIVLLPMCFLTGYFAAIYPHVASSGRYYNMIIMAGVGLCVAGPDSVLGGAACSEVCEKAKKPNAIATATGIANGMGSVGAIARGALPILIKERYGWDALFYFLGGLSIIGMLCIFPMALVAFDEWQNERKKED
jgi:MFS transporter, OPA family, sugar phosphate sensor protein UhpC